MANLLSERVIEDILALDKPLLSDLLAVDASFLSLIARQKAIESGKLDLLYLCQNQLLLIELKVVPFYDGIISQLNGYEADLCGLQQQNKLIHAPIRKIALVSGHEPQDILKCEQESIQLVSYRPEDVLTRYYEHFRELSTFLHIYSGDYGTVRLGLLKSTLKLLAQGNDIQTSAEAEGKSYKTIRNRVSVAGLLGLVAKSQNGYFLTELGNAFIEADTESIPLDRLTDGQIEVLSGFVKDNPFYSSITYTICSIVESVFVLSKSLYPVSKEALRSYFVTAVGKDRTWKTARARETATYIFSNYACELLFLAKVGNGFYLTPEGIRLILLLQLNRSIKLIGAQK